MFYGAPVTAPMQIPVEAPSRFRPEMGELPAFSDAGVGTLRTQGTLAKRKPPIADVTSENLSSYASVNPSSHGSSVRLMVRYAKCVRSITSDIQQTQ